jgi:hypothetical protein
MTIIKTVNLVFKYQYTEAFYILTNDRIFVTFNNKKDGI